MNVFYSWCQLRVLGKLKYAFSKSFQNTITTKINKQNEQCAELKHLCRFCAALFDYITLTWSTHIYSKPHTLDYSDAWTRTWTDYYLPRCLEFSLRPLMWFKTGRTRAWYRTGTSISWNSAQIMGWDNSFFFFLTGGRP